MSKDMNAYYLVENNPSLVTLFEGFLHSRQRTLNNNKALADELGVTHGMFHHTTNALTAVNFPRDKVHPQFKKPKRPNDPSYPKVGTEWEAKFKANVGTTNQVQVLTNALGVPLTLFYKKNEDGTGGGAKHIGYPLNECGWMFADGVLGFFIPNVEEYVAQGLAAGLDFEESSLTFSMDIPNCRRISKAEWDLEIAVARVKAEKAAAVARPAANEDLVAEELVAGDAPAPKASLS